MSIIKVAEKIEKLIVKEAVNNYSLLQDIRSYAVNLGDLMDDHPEYYRDLRVLGQNLRNKANYILSKAYHSGASLQELSTFRNDALADVNVMLTKMEGKISDTHSDEEDIYENKVPQDLRFLKIALTTFAPKWDMPKVKQAPVEHYKGPIGIDDSQTLNQSLPITSDADVDALLELEVLPH